jgi:cytochrome P450
MTIDFETSSTPVSFDPMAPDYLADPFPVLARLRHHAPVFHQPELDMWVVTRHRDIAEILKDHKQFTGANTQTPMFPLCDRAQEILAEGFGARPTMSNGPEPRHSEVRAQCMKFFTARELAELAPMVRARADELISDMLLRNRFDVVSELTFPLPASVVFALIGFPPEDTYMLKGLAAERMAFVWGNPTAEQQVEVAGFMVQYWQYCLDFVQRRLADPREDFTSGLVRIHLEDPRALTVDEIVNVVYSVSFAGHETTTNVATSALLRLLSNRPQWEALCADVTLVQQTVEEALRFDPSLFTWRRQAATDCEIGGVPVPAGAKLLLLIGSANHDPDAFPEPESFDIRRRLPSHHLTFGKGIHYCLGASLARMEIAAVLEMLSQRAPTLRLAPGQELEYPINTCVRGPRALQLEWAGA